MSIINLIAAFGGGAFAASIGALPAFIMTGVFAVVGAVAAVIGAVVAAAACQQRARHGQGEDKGQYSLFHRFSSS